jgi:hypothetical protein
MASSVSSAPTVGVVTSLGTLLGDLDSDAVVVAGVAHGVADEGLLHSCMAEP